MCQRLQEDWKPVTLKVFKRTHNLYSEDINETASRFQIFEV